MKKYINSNWKHWLNIEISNGDNEKLLKDFYALYTKEAINRWKIKTLPYRKKLLECLFREKLLKIFSIYEKKQRKINCIRNFY